MTDSRTITLSFAEVAFVLSLAESDGGELACRRLGVPHLQSDDQLASAGLASLALRGFAGQRESNLELAPQVAAVGVALMSASQTATVAVTVDAGTIVTQLFVGDVQSVAVRRVALGCYQFDGLSDDAALQRLVPSLFASALNDGPCAVAALINDQTRLSAVARDGSVVVTLDDGGETGVELAEIENAIGSLIESADGRPS